MTILQTLLAAKNEPRFDDDGEAIELELLPPATSSEIEQLAVRAGGTLDDELRELLATTRGFTGPLPIEVLDLVSGDFAIECDFLFPRMHPIASDGTGNFWIVDLTRPAPSLGPVYYVCHDPPVVACQAGSAAAFLAELLGGDSVRRVYDEDVFRIWRKNPPPIPSTDAVSSPDPELAAFARTLEPSWVIFDLRNAAPGTGFPWGRFGSRPETKRHDRLPIFAFRSRTGFLRRLFR